MDKNAGWTSFIEQLKSRNDIVDVVGSYIHLEQKGRLYWGCCPFHHERTPSFVVNREGQFYKCFGGGCSASGDVIKFVQEMESADFMGAVEILAKKAGLEIPQISHDREAKEKKEKKTLQLEICLETAKFYRKVLLSEKGVQARKYLAERGISAETITKFGIGLSPDWESLPAHLKEKKFNLDYAVEAGVINKKSGYFDALAQRLIVPIINALGEVVAFGGRSFEKNPQFGKYVNTKQTPLFDKSRNLFAINLVKKKKQTEKIGYIIVVEGYMDAMALNQAGFETTVASMGTSLTAEQAKLAKRYVDTVYICYDGDSAGQSATLKGLDILKSEGLNVRVIQMPKDTDPDELVLQKGKEAFEKLLENALPLTDYKLKVLRTAFDFENPNKTLADEARWKYASAALEVISKCENLVEAETYLASLQKESGFSLDWLKRQMSEGVSLKTPAVFEDKKQGFKPDRLDKARYFILACMLYDEPFAADYRLPDFGGDEFLKSAFDYVFECKKANKKPIPSILYDLFDADSYGKVDYVLNLTLDTTLQNNDYFSVCTSLLKRDEITKKIKELNVLYESEKDLLKQNEIAAQIAVLMKEQKNLCETKKGEANDF